MPIPFRHANEVEELGAAAYLKIEEHPAGYMGALFPVQGVGLDGDSPGKHSG